MRSNQYKLVPADIRFWGKVKKGNSNECWEWQGFLDENGYGIFSLTHTEKMLAHRFAFQNTNGKIPDGLVIDHLCRNHACVNPAHLEPVTIGENVKRGESAKIEGARRRAITHCPQGHPYSGDNLYINPKGARMCKICMMDAKNRHRNRLHEQGLTCRKTPILLPEQIRNANRELTHCPHGHPYTPENTYYSQGCRKCRACVIERYNQKKLVYYEKGLNSNGDPFSSKH